MLSFTYRSEGVTLRWHGHLSVGSEQVGANSRSKVLTYPKTLVLDPKPNQLNYIRPTSEITCTGAGARGSRWL